MRLSVKQYHIASIRYQKSTDLIQKSFKQYGIATIRFKNHNHFAISDFISPTFLKY